MTRLCNTSKEGNSIGRYLDFYNRRRPHSSLDGGTPDQAYFTSLLRKLGGARMAMMGFLFFPFLGLGLFAIQIGRGIAPALFALAMLLTYSVVMGVVYATLNS